MVSEQRVSCSLGVRRPALLLLLLVQLATSQNAGCPHQCVPVAECPELALLLKNTTTENIQVLRQAVCAIRDGKPKVCCPSDVGPPHMTLLPERCGLRALFSKFDNRRAYIGQHPWMAVLGYSEAGVEGLRFLCGGSVISERYVLTSAQCLQPSALNPSRRLEVIRLGEWDLSTEVDCSSSLFCGPPVQDFTYEEITIHPDYNTRGPLSDDVALIRLDRPVNITGIYITSVCLPPQDEDVRKIVETKPVVAGWGLTDPGTINNTLLNINLPLVGSEECTTTYRGNVADEQICVRNRGNEISCFGDLGGPLVGQGRFTKGYIQVGVMSHKTATCSQGGVAGVYTSLTRYRNWIEMNLKP